MSSLNFLPRGLWGQNNESSCGQIGGPGMTVEIDESKFGKTKFNCGRYIEGQWVFGGICRQRDKDTLLPIIRAHMLPGTCVMSDMWKVCLKDKGYTHLTVNHSINFVDPDTGAHLTQRIGNTWWGVKRSMPHTGTSKDLFQSYLQEWLWRQHYEEDAFGNIIKHIADLYEVSAKMRKFIRSAHHCMHCSWCDRRFMEERNKIHSFNTWEGIGGRKSEGKQRPKTRCRYLHWFYFSTF